MASGAWTNRVVGRAIMECDDLVRIGERAMAGVALGAAKADKMGILRIVAHRVTGEAGDGHWWRCAGEVLAFLNGIADILGNEVFVVAMADNAIAPMDGVDISHSGRDMTRGDTAGGDGNHIMLLGCRWDRMICLVFLSVAVGAILELT